MTGAAVDRIRSADVSVRGIGRVRISASDKGICGIGFLRRSAGKHALSRTAPAVLRKAAEELRLYAQGRLKRFSVPVDISRVTGFTKLVLQRTQKIPYGRTINYRQLASALGRPHACRAAGNSLGKNPVPIIIPCHRVIKADGSPGGFSSGVERKELLLKLEGISF